MIDSEDKKYIDRGELFCAEKELDNTILVESSLEGIIICMDDDDFYLEQDNIGRKGFRYSIFSPLGELISRWYGFQDLSTIKDIKRSPVYERFMRDIESYKDYLMDEADELENAETEEADVIDVDADNDADDYLWNTRSYSPLIPYSYSRSYPSNIGKKETGFVDKLSKSDTLVFHKDDPTTRMLCQVYEGKGWDILTTPCYRIDDEELKELFAKHDKLVFLGHGSPSGLIGMFDNSVAPLMKDKKIFAIWCNADKYFKANGIGNGCFITKNIPSEVWESRAAGCGNISAELMLENITYWSKLCADVVEKALAGDVDEAVDYVRSNYLKKYGNHPVSIYNAIGTQKLGSEKPLPEYHFEGKPLEPKDYPIPGFIEKEFLENPTPEASKCPHESIPTPSAKDVESDPDEAAEQIYLDI